MNSVSNSKCKGKSIAAPDTTGSVDRRRKQFLIHTYIFMYIYFLFFRRRKQFLIHTYIFIYMYIYLCLFIYYYLCMFIYIYTYNIDRTYARSDWSKTHVLSEYKA